MAVNRHFQPWRRLVRILLILLAFGIPFVKINGESALRFDVPSLMLHFFGAGVALDEFFLVLIAILFFSFLFILGTLLFGRIWCGWVCPQTVVSDITRFVDRSNKNNPLRVIGVILIVALFSGFLAVDILWYFVSPYEFLVRLREGMLGPIIGWSWGVLTLVTALNFLFLRRKFCATVCPYAKLQGTLYDEQTMIVTMDQHRRDECMGCEACVRTCPVEIDVREGVQSACINCAECIDACAQRMERRARPSLIGYRFGLKDTLTFSRKGVFFSAAASVLFLGLLVYLLATRQQLDMLILPDARMQPKVLADGSIMHSYIVSFTNRTGKDLSLSLKAYCEEREYKIIPEIVRVGRGDHERIILTLMSPPHQGREQTSKSIIIIATPASGEGPLSIQRITLWNIN